MIDVLRFVGLVADVVRRAATQRGPHSAREQVWEQPARNRATGTAAS